MCKSCSCKYAWLDLLMGMLLKIFRGVCRGTTIVIVLFANLMPTTGMAAAVIPYIHLYCPKGGVK